MEITSLASALGIVQNNKINNAENNSEHNFLNSLINVAVNNRNSDNIPTVYAGEGKSFDFWLKEEKVPGKPSKLRTLDDVIAEIDKIVRDIKREK